MNPAPPSAPLPEPARPDPEELRLLAGLLAQPGEESLETLESLMETAPWLGAPVAELRELPLNEWRGEHTRLFVNGIPRTICPPFESAWRQKLMGGESAVAAMALYQRAGLAPVDVPPDYLGALLECAAHLMMRDDGEGSRQVLEELWRDHLLSWVPEWARTLAEKSDLELYRVLADRLTALMAQPPVDSLPEVGAAAGQGAKIQ